MKKLLLLCVAAGFGFITTSRSQPSCVPPPAGLIAWWRGEGNGLDSAGTNNATLVGDVGFTNGLVGQGFVISGAGNDYVALPQNVFPFPSSGTGNAPLTFEVWFKTSIGGVILGQQDHAPFMGINGWVPALYVGTNGLLYGHLFEGAGTPPFIESETSVFDGQFHHGAVTYDGANEYLFLDGVLVASMPFTQQSYGSGNYQYQLGTGYTAGWPGTAGGWFPFAGVIDEASIYNRALATNEIAAIFAAGTAGKCTSIQTSPAVLRHRYDFGDAAASRVLTDSVGGANGTIEFASTSAPYTNGVSDGSGFTGAGRLVLKGTNGYAHLPAGIVSTLTNATFEAWIIWNGPATSAWQRVFDFGASDQGINASGSGTNYLVLTPGDASYRPGFEATINAGADPNTILLEGQPPLPLGQETYLAVTYDPISESSALYTNGALAYSVSQPLDSMNRFADENNWLGRSQYRADPFFDGQYDEFRIWEGVLTPAQIASHFAAGPDEPFGVTRPSLGIARAGRNVVISWPTNGAAGFHLETCAALRTSSWTLVTNTVSISNATWSVSLVATGAPAFYRLKQ